MNVHIEKVDESIRPKNDFVCATCPFAIWGSGSVEYENYSSTVTLEIQVLATNAHMGKDEFLDCYCEKKHIEVFDSTNRTTTKLQKENKTIVIYKNRTSCGTKDKFINELLKQGD
jgi:hypothetical protein